MILFQDSRGVNSEMIPIFFRTHEEVFEGVNYSRLDFEDAFKLAK